MQKANNTITFFSQDAKEDYRSYQQGRLHPWQQRQKLCTQHKTIPICYPDVKAGTSFPRCPGSELPPCTTEGCTQCIGLAWSRGVKNTAGRAPETARNLEAEHHQIAEYRPPLGPRFVRASDSCVNPVASPSQQLLFTPLLRVGASDLSCKEPPWIQIQPGVWMPMLSSVFLPILQVLI